MFYNYLGKSQYGRAAASVIASQRVARMRARWLLAMTGLAKFA
jgi:hypothetical protein